MNCVATAPTLPVLRAQGCTNFKSRQLLRRVAQHDDAKVGKTGLKGTQYSLLSCVYKLGPLRSGDLARAMKVDASTLNRNFKPMVAAGWLSLYSGSDGRSRLVSITISGREKRTEAQRSWRGAQEGINQLLGAEQVLALHALIELSLERLSPAVAEGDDEQARVSSKNMVLGLVLLAARTGCRCTGLFFVRSASLGNGCSVGAASCGYMPSHTPSQTAPITSTNPGTMRAA